MAKAEWGLKRTCLHCGARFYDLMQQPIICPKCGQTVEPNAPVKQRRSQAAATEPAAVVPAAPVALAAIDPDEAAIVDDDADPIEDSEEEEEDGLIEDASDLGEDDDDMAEVIEHLDEGLEDEV